MFWNCSKENLSGLILYCRLQIKPSAMAEFAQKCSPTRSLTCLCIGASAHWASDREVNGWRVAAGADGSSVAGSAYKVNSLASMPRGWHLSLGAAPWWKTAPRIPLPLCPALESAGCHRTRYSGREWCCCRWRSGARCCGWLALLFPQKWRRWPTPSGSPVPAGKGTLAAACSLGGGTRTGRQHPAQYLHWGSRCGH